MENSVVGKSSLTKTIISKIKRSKTIENLLNTMIIVDEDIKYLDVLKVIDTTKSTVISILKKKNNTIRNSVIYDFKKNVNQFIDNEELKRNIHDILDDLSLKDNIGAQLDLFEKKEEVKKPVEEEIFVLEKEDVIPIEEEVVSIEEEVVSIEEEIIVPEKEEAKPVEEELVIPEKKEVKSKNKRNHYKSEKSLEEIKIMIDYTNNPSKKVLLDVLQELVKSEQVLFDIVDSKTVKDGLLYSFIKKHKEVKDNLSKIITDKLYTYEGYDSDIEKTKSYLEDFVEQMSLDKNYISYILKLQRDEKTTMSLLIKKIEAIILNKPSTLIKWKDLDD